ncbi:MAG: hypothetical protein J2P31_16845, partial [Blastocatellia bacterium]|nr:hypothetical protein [Blastocatellia bacterium]
MKNTIRFSFEDLCAFFSRYTDRLMVGMISTEGEAPEDVHAPRIVIKRDGVVVHEYRGWSEVNGDICLEVYPEGEALRRYQPQWSGDPRRPIGMLLDIEKDLHPSEQMQFDPMLCRARFYFRNGELYSTNPYTNLRFEDFETGEVCEHGPKEMAVKAGLDVEIPEEGYAVLRFFNGSEDFVFRSGSDYEVSVANVAEAITGEHSRFIYKIARSQPEHVWYCAGGESMGLPVAGTGGQAGCLIHEDDL